MERSEVSLPNDFLALGRELCVPWDQVGLPRQDCVKLKRQILAPT
jgi:hypothetical protein